MVATTKEDRLWSPGPGPDDTQEALSSTTASSLHPRRQEGPEKALPAFAPLSQPSPPTFLHWTYPYPSAFLTSLLDVSTVRTLAKGGRTKVSGEKRKNWDTIE